MWSDDICLLKQYQGYKAPFFVEFCRLLDDISFLEQDQGSKVFFFRKSGASYLIIKCQVYKLVRIKPEIYLS